MQFRDEKELGIKFPHQAAPRPSRVLSSLYVEDEAELNGTEQERAGGNGFWPPDSFAQAKPVPVSEIAQRSFFCRKDEVYDPYSARILCSPLQKGEG
jgi:hypothetical protein